MTCQESMLAGIGAGDCGLAVLSAATSRPTRRRRPPPRRRPRRHSHEGWWCNEHGVPEEVCALCNAKLVADFKAKGDWCKEHDRPDSQCFVCHPEKEAEFAALYEAKYGKKPPKPTCGESTRPACCLLPTSAADIKLKVSTSLLASDPDRRKAIMARQLAYAILAALALLAVAAAAYDWFTPLPPDAQCEPRPTSAARPAPSAISREFKLWHGSHHDRAMEIATDETVLGDFNDATFERLGVTTRFFRRDGKFMVNTEGPDGQNHDYEIKYTFGIDPLQQYMVEFPDGRVQVLRVSWDTQKKRWFEVTPPDVAERAARAGRPAALDRRRAELEHDLRRVPFDESAEELRSRHDTYHTTFQRNRRQLRRVPRAGERARRAGQALVAVLGSQRRLRPGESQERRHHACKSKPARSAIRAAHMIHDDFRPGQPLLDYYEPVAALRRAVPRRRPDSRRSLRIRLVPGKQDARQPRPLHRLPRSAFAQAEVRRQPALHAVSHRRQVRHARASSSSGRLGRRASASPATCRCGPTW